MSLIDDAERLFIYAYPVVTSGVLSQGPREGSLTLTHGRKFTTPYDDFNIVRPNNDTLYSCEWIYLKESPYVLTVPEIKDRYLLLDFLDTKTNVVFSAGSKNKSGTTEGKYIILFRNAPLPDGYEDYTVVRSNDSRNFFIVRLESFGEDDFTTADSLQDKITLKPVFPELIQDHGKKITGLSTFYIESLGLEEFYRKFAESFPDTLIDPEYKKLAAEFNISESEFNLSSLQKEKKEALEQGAESAYKKIKAGSGRENQAESNNWLTTIKDLGYYGKNYILAAQVAYYGYGANLAEDSIYPATDVDINGAPLISDKKYKVHFKKGGLPEAKFFWSLTMYGLPSQFLTKNEINRYVINSHMLKDLKFNDDGSLDIILQQEKPEDADLLSNWLPTPSDEKRFSLLLRIYGPSDEQLNGNFEAPVVTPVFTSIK